MDENKNGADLTRARSRSERKSEAVLKLLQAGARIVAERGLEGFSLADVGEAAGFSRGLPAHHFGNRDGFLVALADHIVGTFGDGPSNVATDDAGLDRLLGSVSLYFDRAQRDILITRAAVAVQGNVTSELLKTRVQALNARGISHIEAQIAAGIASGRIRKTVVAKAQAILILSGLRAAVAFWLVDPNLIDLRILQDEFISSLRRNLSA